MYIKKGDKVQVLSGKDRGKQGVVLRALPAENKVVVEGVSVVKKAVKPNAANQQGGIIAGRSYIVYLYEDSVTGRCVATMKFKSYVNNDVITVKPREEVSLLVASESPIGYRVIVNNRHWGMIYRNQLFRRIDVGDRLKGYVTRITEDNRIDVSLQQQGVAEVRHSAETLLSMIHENGGSLPLNDDSDPAEIATRTQMSKKVFKRSLGMLLKRGAVEITQNGVKLTGHNG